MPLPSPPRLRTLCALALAFCLSSAASAQTAADIDRLAVPEEVAAYVMQPDIAAALNLRVSAEPNGFTPNLIGYNMSVHEPGNNVSGWLRSSEINSARHWWSQKSWPAPPARWRNRDQTLDHFNQQRAQLRGDPRQELAALTRIIVADRGPPPPGTLGHLFSLSEMIKNDITPLVQLNHNTRTIPFDRPDGSPDWHGRWTYWRGVYLNAFYLAATYGVERFQLFNEPDYPNSEPISQTEYVRRLQIGSDALHAAIADVNQRAGRNLHPGRLYCHHPPPRGLTGCAENPSPQGPIPKGPPPGRPSAFHPLGFPPAYDLEFPPPTATASCPQPAAISIPRRWRTVLGNPYSASTS